MAPLAWTLLGQSSEEHDLVPLDPWLIATHYSDIQHPEPICAVVEARRNDWAWVILRPPITQSNFQLSEKRQDTFGGSLQSPERGGSSSMRKRRSPGTCMPLRVRPVRVHPSRSVNTNAALSRTTRGSSSA